MDANDKKTALRMIPYGLYVLTAESKSGSAAATVNWVTQASFPRAGRGGREGRLGRARLIKESGLRAQRARQGPAGPRVHVLQARRPPGLDDLGRGVSRGGDRRAHPREHARLRRVRLVATVEKGDHSVFIGEVVDAGVAKAPEGRADDATLWLKDLGDKVFYGG